MRSLCGRRSFGMTIGIRMRIRRTEAPWKGRARHRGADPAMPPLTVPWRVRTRLRRPPGTTEGTERPTDRGRLLAAGMRPCLPLADRTGKTAPGVRRESMSPESPGAFRKEMPPGSRERDRPERLTGNRRNLPRKMGGNRRPPGPGRRPT